MLRGRTCVSCRVLVAQGRGEAWSAHTILFRNLGNADRILAI
jgi:hypothetical protein